MDALYLSLLIMTCIFAASLGGMLLRRLLPEHHLGRETRESVLLAMGLVATMSALVLGLLIATAKDKYDKEAAGISEMAAKINFLDRMLSNYGPEAADARGVLRRVVERTANHMWPSKTTGEGQLDPTVVRGESLFAALQALSPKNDMQTAIKTQAISAAFDIGQLRWQELEEANAPISVPLLYVLTFWLAILFVSFGLFSPSNGTVIVSLLMAAMTVAGAIFLMMEFNSPFGGLLQIPRTPFDDVLVHLGK